MLFKIFLISNIATFFPGIGPHQYYQPSFYDVNEKYVCMPCGQDCDKKVYRNPGICPKCKMQLVEKSFANFRTIQPSQICEYIQSHPHIVLLDVRTKQEFEGNATPDFGTFKNAINIPLQELEANLPLIDSLKEKEIIVYCSHSHRSPQASYLLQVNGFKNIINMEGGMSAMEDNTCKK